MNVLSLFDGISCGRIALDRANVKYEKYFSSEIDKHALQVSGYNYPNNIQLGDVKDWENWQLPKIDLLIGGSPCQGFSFAGKQLNFNDERSKLFFNFVEIKKKLEPKFFFLENVGMKREYLNIISDFLETEPIKINSNLLSAQNRIRYYWTNIKFDLPEDKKINLKDIIGEYEGIYVRPRGGNSGGVKAYKGKSPCITTSSWEHNFFPVKDGKCTKFTPNQAELLQTIPIDYTMGLSDHQRFKVIGNAWTVDVIGHIFSYGLVED